MQPDKCKILSAHQLSPPLKHFREDLRTLLISLLTSSHLLPHNRESVPNNNISPPLRINLLETAIFALSCLKVHYKEGKGGEKGVIYKRIMQTTGTTYDGIFFFRLLLHFRDTYNS